MERQRTRSAVWKKAANALAQVVHDHCAATGDYASDVAEAVGISPQYLSNQCGGTYPASVDVLVHVTRLTGDTRAVATVARLCGGSFVALPSEGDATVAELADVIQAHATAIAQVAEIYRDGRMDATEARHAAPDAEAACDALVEAALGLRERLKADERRARNGRAASLSEAEAHR